MSKFETKIMLVENSTDHPNADRLSIVKLSGYDYRIVSAKLEDGSHRYTAGDTVIYVQADTLVPEYLLKQGFWDETKNRGFLAGSNGNRVKPIKLRGITSEGIIFPVTITLEDGSTLGSVSPGDDVSEILGTTKYEPEIPVNMAGEVLYIGQHNTLKYDIENAKKWPGVLDRWHYDLYLTEKLHGTFCGIGYLPNFEHDELFTLPGVKGSFIVFSKGLGGQGLVFKNNEKNANNIYVRTALENDLFAKLHKIKFGKNENSFLLGEIFGKGIQDLHYSSESPKFRAFELYGDGKYVSATFKYIIFENNGIEAVPVLAVVEKESEIAQFIDGQSTLGGNIREGLVAIPAFEQTHEELGRVILKYVSDDYLNRKGNVTEYQ